MRAALANLTDHPSWIRFSRKMPGIVAALLLFLIGLSIAQIVWLAVAPASDMPEATAQNAPVKPSIDGGDTSRKLAALHIFGQAERVQAVAKPQPKQAPETRLNLKLRGVFALDDENLGVALISNGNGPEEVYLVNDNISSSTKLAAVYPDRVMLDIGGRFETLRLPETKDTGMSYTPTANVTPQSTFVSPKADFAESMEDKTLGEYRSEFLRNPTVLARLVNIAQAEDDSGNPIGYRVTANGHHPAFDKLGVEDGDVVTAINGIELDSTAKGMSAFQALRQSKQVTVQLLRDGQPMTLNLTF